MAEGLKKEELDLSTDKEELDIILDDEKEDKEMIIENDDLLDINISSEDIDDLTNEECDIVLVKLEVAIDKCEDDLAVLESFEELSNSSFDLEKYKEKKNELKRLNELEKKVRSHQRNLKRGTKEGGLFGNLPVWAFILFIVCALFTIVPVNPYFPIQLYIDYSDKIGGFINTLAGAYTFYFLYLGLFVITEIVIFVILLIKGLKSKEKMGTFKSYLVMFIINIIIDIPGLILFLRAATAN